jgi:hypothetical protein
MLKRELANLLASVLVAGLILGFVVGVRVAEANYQSYVKLRCG